MSKLSTMISTGFIACAPFEVKHVENKVKNGVAFSEQRASLTKLTALSSAQIRPDSETTIIPGCEIYVRGESFKAEWARKEYEIDGEKFILVPFDAILLTSYAIRPFTPIKVTPTANVPYEVVF